MKVLSVDYMEEVMIGRIDGRQRTDGRTDGRTERPTDGRKDRRTDYRTDGRSEGRTDGRTDARKDERTIEHRRTVEDGQINGLVDCIFCTIIICIPL